MAQTTTAKVDAKRRHTTWAATLYSTAADSVETSPETLRRLAGLLARKAGDFAAALDHVRR